MLNKFVDNHCLQNCTSTKESQHPSALFSDFIQSSPEGTFLLHIFETGRCAFFFPKSPSRRNHCFYFQFLNKTTEVFHPFYNANSLQTHPLAEIFIIHFTGLFFTKAKITLQKKSSFFQVIFWILIPFSWSFFYKLTF